MPYLLILRRFWKPALIAIVLASAIWSLHSWGEKREAEGRKAATIAVEARWAADTAKRDAATLKAAEAARMREEAAKAHNQEVLGNANAQLVAIAADRDSLFGRMRDYENRLRAESSRAAGDRLGLDVVSGIASRAEEARRGIEERWDAYDKSCQRDAVRFSALQDQLRPQL